ncbi:MAG TPA: hypothetical protein P5184_01150, partial [Bacteroidales bacterium]|nr:hypothetical protein [Bacteroidales bacterium]
MIRGFVIVMLMSATAWASAQTQPQQPAPESKEKQSIMIDTLDHKLDWSRYLIEMHGFIPWPSIVSEPALGDFGLAMALVFISPKASAKAKANYTFPDITGVAGMWTLNDSWGVAALRQGSFPKARMRYRIAAGYAPL